MTEVNQLFQMVSIWRDFYQNQLIKPYNQLFETYQFKNHIDLHRLRLNQISKQNSEHKQSRGVLGLIMRDLNQLLSQRRIKNPS